MKLWGAEPSGGRRRAVIVTAVVVAAVAVGVMAVRVSSAKKSTPRPDPAACERDSLQVVRGAMAAGYRPVVATVERKGSPGPGEPMRLTKGRSATDDSEVFGEARVTVPGKAEARPRVGKALLLVKPAGPQRYDLAPDVPAISITGSTASISCPGGTRARQPVATLVGARPSEHCRFRGQAPNNSRMKLCYKGSTPSPVKSPSRPAAR